MIKADTIIARRSGVGNAPAKVAVLSRNPTGLWYLHIEETTSGKPGSWTTVASLPLTSGAVKELGLAS